MYNIRTGFKPNINQHLSFSFLLFIFLFLLSFCLSKDLCMDMYNTPQLTAYKMLITSPNTDNLDLVMENCSRIFQQEIENYCNLRGDGKNHNKFSVLKSFYKPLYRLPCNLSNDYLRRKIKINQNLHSLVLILKKKIIKIIANFLEPALNKSCKKQPSKIHLHL